MTGKMWNGSIANMGPELHSSIYPIRYSSYNELITHNLY